ncbi:MAG: RHS repeat-associated core domain-containing protein [Chthoniobacter sp.]|uniref:RHS repeat domain-containing protein n=1 Tax=Chthoniobacter sp. TaxID=2510640 RepID=UPI0032A7895D
MSKFCIVLVLLFAYSDNAAHGQAPVPKVPLFRYYAWSKRYSGYTYVAQGTGVVYVLQSTGPALSDVVLQPQNNLPWGPPGWNLYVYPVTVYIGVLPEEDFGDSHDEVVAFNQLTAALSRTVKILSAPSPATNPNLETKCDPLLGGNSSRCPMMTYAAHASARSLRVEDTPLTYTPAFGPPVDATIFYTDGGTVAGGVYATNGGWRCALDAWLQDDPSAPTAAIQILPRGGGVETFSGYIAGGGTAEDKFTNNRWANATLYRLATGGYERRFADGSVETYDQNDGATTAPRRWFLTQVRDAWGNAATFQRTGGKLTSCTDAAGKVTHLIYDATFPERLWKLVDHFGRTATLGYDNSGRLISCTDPVGILSQVTYGADGKIDSLTTPYGTSHFTRDPAGSWLEMRDPNNTLERLENRYIQPDPITVTVNGIAFLAPQTVATPSTLFHWAALDPTSRTFPAKGWIAAGLLPQSNEVEVGPWNGAGSRRLDSADEIGARGTTTYFWDKKATMTGHMQDADAQQIGWAFDSQGSGGFRAWSKNPLEAPVRYVYAGQTDPGVAPNGLVTESYRSVNGIQKLQQNRAEYNNPLSLITKAIDPVGRTNSFVYDPANPVDLTEVHNITGGRDDLLASCSNYLNHRPQAVTDAAGQQTIIGYNTRGQVQSVTNAKGEVTQFAYDDTPAQPGFGRLVTVTRASGTAFAAATHYALDAYGRVQTVTDSEGYAVNLAYDAVGGDPLQSVDRVTRVNYPDTTYRETRYDDARWPLDAAHTRDRLGHVMALEYDNLRNLVKVTDPQNRVTQFIVCPCGARDKIIDPAGNETEWGRDLEKRIISKTIAGQLVATYTYEPGTGRLSTVTDALSQITTYGYAADDRLASVTYANTLKPTANLGFIDDPAYPRLTSMTDGTGQTNYGYYPIAAGTLGAGQLQTVAGPLGNSTITYTYDELGRANGRSINGATNASSVSYDALGRVAGYGNPLGNFVPSYVNQTARLDHLQVSNGQQTRLLTNYAWKPNAQDQRLDSITHLDPTAQTQSQHSYSYDAEGEILSWQSVIAGSTAQYTFGYNASNELENAVQRAQPSQNLLHSASYGYDSAGNRVAVNEDGKYTSYPANAKNQLTTSSGTGPLELRGTVSKPSTITLAGQPVTMDGLNWSGRANVSPGANSLELKATETNPAAGANAQTTTRHIAFTLTADPARTFVYDANGNMTDNGSDQTYEWDAANRLVAISYTGTNLRTEFSYDGLSRRVAIFEKNNGAVTSEKHFVWDGFTLAEERDASDSVTKQFYGNGEVRGTLKLYYARDHLGSVREVTDAAGVLRARYDYTPWGGRSDNAITGVNAIESDFGFTGHYLHASSGLHLAPYRAYSATLGRWLSRDPIEEDGGIDLYGYVHDSPINLVDPLGLRDVDVLIWGWTGTGVGLPGSSVGHVLIKEHNSAKVLLSQFPHECGAPSHPHGPNTKLNLAQTIAEEGRAPVAQYVVHVPDDAAFDAAVAALSDPKITPRWTPAPTKPGETQCAASAYLALSAGGVNMYGYYGGAILPDDLATILNNLIYIQAPADLWSVRMK